MSLRVSVSSMRAAAAGAVVALGLALSAAPAAAQAQGQPAVPPNVKLGQTYGSWQSACETIQGTEQCFIFQRISGSGGKVAGQVKVGRLGPNKEPVLLADLPMNVLLPAGVVLQVDGGNEVRVPYMYCQPGVCSTSVPLNDQMVTKMKAGSNLGMTVVLLPAQRPLKIDASLSGFTAAFDSLK